ncbi:hypothetical protein F5883DRAFT_146255 [Diaporthe sp. PMI_573]|nr:hypothetical protein F5883DRAFT_146255 [Diaporthaceae sp. PMI_573]
MVEIDGGARAAAGGVLALLLQLQLAAPAWPPTLASHWKAAFIPAFHVLSRLSYTSLPGTPKAPRQLLTVQPRSRRR